MVDKCIILGNTYANVLQVIVFCLAVFSLFLHKIIVENNICGIFKSTYYTRTWKIWFLDNFKQGFSTFISHWWAVFVSIYLGSDTDQCGMYLIQYLVDSVVGILLSFLLSRGIIKLLSYWFPNFTENWLSIGYYNNISGKYYFIWFFQLIYWCICSLIARAVCTTIILIGYNGFVKLNIQFANAWSNKHIELIFVVLVIPLIFNILVFLLQNWFLKYKHRHTELDIILINKSPDYV